jgi:hypothetical protein
MTRFRRLANRDPNAARVRLREVFEDEHGYVDQIAAKLGVTRQQYSRFVDLLGLKDEFGSRRWTLSFCNLRKEDARGKARNLIARKREQRKAGWPGA